MNKIQIEQELNILQQEGQILSLKQQKDLKEVGNKYQKIEKELHNEKDVILKELQKRADDKNKEIQRLQEEVTQLSNEYSDVVMNFTDKIVNSQSEQLKEQDKINDDYLESIVINSEKQRNLYIQLQSIS